MGVIVFESSPCYSSASISVLPSASISQIRTNTKVSSLTHSHAPHRYSKAAKKKGLIKEKGNARRGGEEGGDKGGSKGKGKVPGAKGGVAKKGKR